MRLTATIVLLVSLSVAHAGVFQRQCYPETIYATAAMSAITRTVTETEVVVATETVTIRPRPVTVTAVITDFKTVYDTAGTATKSLQDPPSYAAGAITPAYSVAQVSSTITVALTETVFLTETMLLTSLGNSSTSTAPFPTINVTGTMGINPSSAGNAGTAPGTASVGSAGIASTVSNTDPTSAAGLSGSSPLISVNYTGKGIATSAATLLNVTFSTTQTATLGTSSVDPFNATESNTITKSLSIGGIAPSATFGTQSTTNLSAPSLVTSQMTLAGKVNATTQRTVLGTGTGTVLPSITSFSDSMSALTVSANVSNVSETLTALSGSFNFSSSGQAVNISVVQTSSLSVFNSTNVQVPPTTTDNTIKRTPLAPAVSTEKRSFSITANFTASRTVLSAAGATTTQPSLSVANATAEPSQAEATNGTVFHTSSVVPNATASVGRRCPQEDPFAWRTNVKYGEGPLTVTLPDGKVVTRSWNKAQQKRQVGQFITITIDGQVVSWANNWDGTGTVDLATFSESLAKASSTPAEAVTTSTVQLSTMSSSIIAPTAANTDISAPSPHTTVSGAQLLPSNSLAWISSSGLAITTALSGSSHSPASPSLAPPTFGESLTATMSLLPISSPEVDVKESIQAVPTDMFITYTPPSWLSSLFPPDPTADPISNSALPSTASAKPTSFAATTSSVAASVTPSMSSSSIGCNGNHVGEFTINFDDLPVVGEPSTNDQYAPLSNPYHELFWSQGYSYVPPPTDPYLPHSGSQLGIFIVDGDVNVHSQNWTGPIPQGSDVNGMFGAGKNYQNPHYYIDAQGAWIGCKNSGPGDCDIQINGFAYDDGIGKSVVQVIQHFYQPPCPSLTNCSLEYFEFSQAFRNLTAVQIQATVQSDPGHTAVTWYADDIALAWSDNSCAAVHDRDTNKSPVDAK